jgi:saccharopine dehydrogenase-like NADP-dependent oxidoreductase
VAVRVRLGASDLGSQEESRGAPARAKLAAVNDAIERPRALVLGGGKVGSAMVMDLAAQGARVTVADASPATLEALAARYGAATVRADLDDPAEVTRLARGYDVVLGALPSRMGLATLRAVIEAGSSYVDISFMPEDPLELDALARERGVTAIVDCGVGPGTSNVLVGYAASRLEVCESIAIYVGGLPVVRSWPFEYKAAFAPHDVIEEYTRPSRIVEHGQVVVREALSEPELMDFPGVGTLEAFNTDGLRSLARTMRAPFMKEKTLRYPGHIALMRVLRDMGLFSSEPIDVGGARVAPRALAEQRLFPRWAYDEGEEDLTVMRVVVEGREGGAPRRYTWDLYDRYDRATGLRSMARTTAFPATIVASLVARGVFRRPGVHPPEVLGAVPGLCETLLQELARRGVRYAASVT